MSENKAPYCTRCGIPCIPWERQNGFHDKTGEQVVEKFWGCPHAFEYNRFFQMFKNQEQHDEFVSRD